MHLFLRIFIPSYFIIYFFYIFIWRSFKVAKHIGKSPLVFPKDESTYALVGFYFKAVIVVLFIYVLAYGLFPGMMMICLPFSFLKSNLFLYTGSLLLLFSFIWTSVAQYQMLDSWRIGLDKEIKTSLVTNGLFRYSRNPVFFGMLSGLAGLFLISPNVLSMMIFVTSYLLIQIQIRLEEEFLLNMHGDKYTAYKQSVRRLI